MSKAEDKKEEVEKKELPYVPSIAPFISLLRDMVVNPRNVFFDIEIAGEKAGRIVFKLYDDIVPKVSPSSFSIFQFAEILTYRQQPTSEVSLLERNMIPTKTFPKDSGTKVPISTGLFLDL